MSQLLTFIATGRATRPNGAVYAPKGLVTPQFTVLQDFMNRPYTAWDPAAPNQRDGSLVSRMFELLGSTTNPGPLVNAERALNSIKARLWQGHDPMSQDLWNEHGYNTADGQHACERVNAALSFLRLVSSASCYRIERC